MMFKVWIGVTFCILCSCASADPDMDCGTLSPECLEACGTDLVEMDRNFINLNRCWLHLNCTQYRSCLSQIRSTSPTPPSNATSVTVLNGTTSLDTSASSKEPRRTAPSSGGCSCNKTTAQPETEQEPQDIYKILFYVFAAILALLAIVLGFAVSRCRSQRKIEWNWFQNMSTHLGLVIGHWCSRSNGMGTSHENMSRTGAQGGIELCHINIQTSGWKVEDKQMIREFYNRVMNRRPGYEEAVRNASSALVRQIQSITGMAAVGDGDDVEARLLSNGAAGDGQMGVKPEDVLLHAVVELIGPESSRL